MENFVLDGVMGYVKLILVSVLVYVVILALLKKSDFFKDDKISALVSLIITILISLSGVVTYVINFAVSWFVIFFFLVFVLVLLMMFLGMSFDDVTKFLNPKIIGGIMAFFLIIILFKGFFGLNNLNDLNNPQNNSYEVNTEFNTGIDDVTGVEVDASVDFDVDSGFLSIAIFLMVIGGVVFFLSGASKK